MTIKANMPDLRNQIEAYLKLMGYYPITIKINSVKGGPKSISIKGEFHEYLGKDRKFSGEYDASSNGWDEFVVEEDKERL